MKRVVSILLAATLMLTPGTVTYATEEKPVQMEYQAEGTGCSSGSKWNRTGPH